MFLLTVRVAGAFAAIAALVNGQSLQRRAAMTGGNNGDRGKCTIEVLVDGQAEIEVRGDMGTIRNLAGQQPQWRRFECTGPLPANPVDFRFSGVDGRGRQDLVREPGNGGAAVVRIEDPEAGAEAYTFDLTWRGGGFPGADTPGAVYPSGDRRGAGYRGSNRGISNDQAVQVCQDAIRQQAVQRFRTPEIEFRRVAPEANSARAEGVAGSFAIRRGNRDEEYRFSCSIDFENGQVRSAQILPLQPVEVDRRPVRGGGGEPLQACQRAVEDRLRSEGYDRVNFGPIRPDNRPGKTDRISGTARADGRNGPDSFDFACRVDPQTGAIRSVDAILR